MVELGKKNPSTERGTEVQQTHSSAPSYKTPAPLPQQASYNDNKPHKYWAPSFFSTKGTIPHRLSDEAGNETERVSQTCPEIPRVLKKQGRFANSLKGPAKLFQAHQPR